MYLVNTSFMVDSAEHDRFLKLLVDKYIPFLIEHGYTDLTFTRVLSWEASGQFTYSLQVGAAQMSDYKRITGELFAEYETIAQDLFGDRVQHFTSLLKKIDYKKTMTS